MENILYSYLDLILVELGDPASVESSILAEPGHCVHSNQHPGRINLCKLVLMLVKELLHLLDVSLRSNLDLCDTHHLQEDGSSLFFTAEESLRIAKMS